MINIAHKREEGLLKHLPVEVAAKAIEVAEDVETIRELIDFEHTLPEYVDLITCENGESYTNSLILLSSDYSISLLIPLSLTPKELLIYMEE